MGLFLVKKINNVKSAYFSPTYFILTPGYQSGLEQNSTKFARLLNLLSAFRKTTPEAESKETIFFVRRVSQTNSLKALIEF